MACNFYQFFISHLARWVRTRRFSEPTFRPSGATNHWKNTVFRDFPTFSRISIFFLLTLSLLSSSLFYSSLLSDCSHLCFSSVHSVGSLTSKLPSISHNQRVMDKNHLPVQTFPLPCLITGRYPLCLLPTEEPNSQSDPIVRLQHPQLFTHP